MQYLLGLSTVILPAGNGGPSTCLCSDAPRAPCMASLRLTLQKDRVNIAHITPVNRPTGLGSGSRCINCHRAEPSDARIERAC